MFLLLLRYKAIIGIALAGLVALGLWARIKWIEHGYKTEIKHDDIVLEDCLINATSLDEQTACYNIVKKSNSKKLYKAYKKRRDK